MHPPSLLLPDTLAQLHRASDAPQRDAAWSAFVREHSDVVLHACRAVAADRDRAMDCYAAVLEALHEDACRRLRAYKPDGKTKFTTWLVVVVRRLALDALRKRYGRPRSSDPTRRDESVARRRLEDLVAAEIDPDQTESGIATPDANVRRADLSAMLNLAIAELEPSDRLLLTLRFKDDRSVRDTARLMGLPSVFHVYRRVSAVLTQLRETLRRRGVEESEP